MSFRKKLTDALDKLKKAGLDPADFDVAKVALEKRMRAEQTELDRERLTPEITRKLREHAVELRKAGKSEMDIYDAVDIYERQLLTERDEAAQAEAYVVPEGLSPQQLAGIELERSSSLTGGGGPRVALPTSDAGAALTQNQVDLMNANRLFEGLPPLSANEIARESLKRAGVTNTEKTEQPYELAKRGMNPMKLAQANLFRAVSGMPPLVAPESLDSEDEPE